MSDYTDFNIDMVRKRVEQIVKDFPKIGLLTEEEVNWKRHVLGNFVIDGLGDKIYQLPGGGLTGEDGWKMFQEVVKKQLEL